MAAASVLLSSNATNATAMQLIGSISAGGVAISAEKDALKLPVPSFDETYAESPDTEGGKRSRSRPSVPKGALKVNISGSTAAIFNSWLRQWQQLVNEIHDWGGQLVYTPQNGNQVTYDLESCYITEMPQESRLIDQNIGSSSIEFPTLPYGRLAPVTNAVLSDIDTFWRDSITNQEWRFDAGTGTLSVTGGVLVPSSTAEKRLNRALNVIDVSQTVIKVTTGASVASGDTGITLKRLDASNEIRARVEFAGASSLLRIAKFDAAVASNLATSGSTFTTAAGTSYWLQASIVGNLITVKLFSQDPNVVASPTQVGATLSFTLTAGDATKFGAGVKGNPGLRFNPQATDYRWDDWRMDSGSIEGFDPVLNFELLNIPGSAPALAKLRLTDMSTQARSYAEWGLDDRYYDRTAPQPTLLDSDVLSTSGLSGVGATRTGAYDPGASGNNVIRATLTTTPVAVCSTGTQTHTGPLKVKTRMYGVGSGPIYVRLAYRIADGPWSRPQGWVKLIQVGGWYEQLLATIRIPKTLSGNQSWEGRIEAYTLSAGADTLDIDFMRISPAKRFGRVRTSLALGTSPVIAAKDEFDQTAGALNAKVSTGPGTPAWATSGVATDWNVDGAGHVTRTGAAAETNYRRAVLPAGLGGDVVVQADFTIAAYPAGDIGQTTVKLLARATGASDTSDAALGYIAPNSSDPNGLMFVQNAAVGTGLLDQNAGTAAAKVIGKLFTAGAGSVTLAFLLASGLQQFACFAGPVGGTLTQVASGSLGGAAPAGTGVGFAQWHNSPSATGRLVTVDNFRSWVPELSSIITPGGNIEVRHNAVLRPNGARLTAEGAYLKIDPSGRDSRGAQIAAAAYRGDIDTQVDDQIGDIIKAEVDLTPRVVLLDG